MGNPTMKGNEGAIMPIQGEETLIEIGKLISLALRHKPEALGLSLGEHGWADVEELINGVRQKFKGFDRETLDLIVETNNKRRYSYDESGKRIRANQGHSIPVDVELKAMTPPDVLYHGTATRFAEAIQAEGLKPMSRLYVHLSADRETATTVGKRHGKPMVFLVDAKRMAESGHQFFLSENGVWLTKTVPPEYLTVSDH